MESKIMHWIENKMFETRSNIQVFMESSMLPFLIFFLSVSYHFFHSFLLLFSFVLHFISDMKFSEQHQTIQFECQKLQFQYIRCASIWELVEEICEPVTSFAPRYCMHILNIWFFFKEKFKYGLRYSHKLLCSTKKQWDLLGNETNLIFCLLFFSIFLLVLH